MKPTKEQDLIIQSVHDHELTKVVACAGTGKTTTLTQIVNALKPKSALYIAFNKAVATEAAEKFPSSVTCSTIHAFAMKYIPRLQISYFTYRDIEEHIPYTSKMQIVDSMEAFFNSDSTCMNAFFASCLDEKTAILAESYVDKMLSLEIPATFGFALKYFHLMLEEGSANIPNFELVMLDEAGDVTGATLAIFRLLKTNRKVMVGDPHQNIYAFMNTIDGFKILENEGNTCTLTKSFRVNQSIAERVELFCQRHMDKNFIYEGIEYTKPTGDTVLYVSRTNSAMIGRMIYLIQAKQGFNLLRSPKEIFALPLALITASSGKPVFDSRFKYLEKEYRDAKKARKDFKSYLAKEYAEDIPLMGAINLLRKHTYGTIFDTYSHAKDMKPNPKNTLGSAHSVKGLERDIVVIDNDLNESILQLIEDGGAKNKEDLAEFNLAYVACTRAKYELRNCKFL